MHAGSPDGVKPSGGFHEVGSASLTGLAGGDNLSVAERSGFEDHLQHPVTARSTHRPHLRFEGRPFGGFDKTKVDHHIDLVGTVSERTLCFSSLHRCMVGAAWKANDRDDFAASFLSR